MLKIPLFKKFHLGHWDLELSYVELAFSLKFDDLYFLRGSNLPMFYFIGLLPLSQTIDIWKEMTYSYTNEDLKGVQSCYICHFVI